MNDMLHDYGNGYKGEKEEASMKLLSEQIKEFQGMLYDNEASAENVRDQLGNLADYVKDLAQAVEQIDRSLNRVSNEASCRANGIIPD